MALHLAAAAAAHLTFPDQHTEAPPPPAHSPPPARPVVPIRVHPYHATHRMKAPTEPVPRPVAVGTNVTLNPEAAARAGVPAATAAPTAALTAAPDTPVLLEFVVPIVFSLR